MNLTAICITTSCHHRIMRMVQTIGALDGRPAGYFSEKILSIDDVGEGIPDWLLEDIRHSGWKVIRGKYGNLTENARIALSHVNTEWVYYTEDDAWFWDEYPSKGTLEALDSRTYDGRPLGIVAFLEGGYDFNSPKAIEYLRDTNNYILRVENGPACIFASSKSIMGNLGRPDHDGWIQFPVSIMRTDVMKQIFAYAKANIKGVQIETALTIAWNRLGLDAKYAKLGFIREPEWEKIQLGHAYAVERGERNLMFRNARFRKGLPGTFHFR